MRKWERLPEFLQNPEIRPYFDLLKKRWFSRFLKRLFDIIVSLIFIVVLLLPMLLIAIIVKLSSRGPVLFKQTRVTLYGRRFQILKFRTMVTDAEKLGPQITANKDPRITKVGNFLRKTRLDELPQLFNVLAGDMSFVGARPEVVKYVSQYSPEWNATLLMRAGITCEASIYFKNEDQLLANSKDIDSDYVKKVLPIKLKFDCEYVKKFNFFYDCHLMWKTFFSML
jgi:lipopolysaccharide/colanic/teichoic acid biosynthesis glycosyltransferase